VGIGEDEACYDPVTVLLRVVIFQQDCHERVDEVDVDVAGQRGILRDSQAREESGAGRGNLFRHVADEDILEPPHVPMAKTSQEVERRPFKTSQEVERRPFKVGRNSCGPGNHHAEAARVPSLPDDLARANCAGLLHSGHVLQSGNDSSVKVGIADAEFLDGRVTGATLRLLPLPTCTRFRLHLCPSIAVRPPHCEMQRGPFTVTTTDDGKDDWVRGDDALSQTLRIAEPRRMQQHTTQRSTFFNIWLGSRGKLRDRFDDENAMEVVQAEEDCECTRGNPSRKLAAVG
ncbi:hypothetical protein THAOC_20186, partial [Thalassiosira oceanica]